MEKYTQIGARIKKLRGGRSQRAFADQLKISIQGYLNYEYGKRVPPGPVLSKIAEVGGVTVDWVLTGAESGANHVHDARAPYGDDKIEKLVKMLRDMDNESRDDVLKYAEEKKQLGELKRKKNKRRIRRRDK